MSCNTYKTRLDITAAADKHWGS